MLRALHDTFEGADAFGKDAVMTMRKDIAKDMADGKLGKIGNAIACGSHRNHCLPVYF